MPATRGDARAKAESIDPIWVKDARNGERCQDASSVAREDASVRLPRARGRWVDSDSEVDDCQEIAATWTSWSASNRERKTSHSDDNISDRSACVGLYSFEIDEHCEDSADRVFCVRCSSHNFGNTATSVGVQEELVNRRHIHETDSDIPDSKFECPKHQQSVFPYVLAQALLLPRHCKVQRPRTASLRARLKITQRTATYVRVCI